MCVSVCFGSKKYKFIVQKCFVNKSVRKSINSRCVDVHIVYNERRCLQTLRLNEKNLNKTVFKNTYIDEHQFSSISLCLDQFIGVIRKLISIQSNFSCICHKVFYFQGYFLSDIFTISYIICCCCDCCQFRQNNKSTLLIVCFSSNVFFSAHFNVQTQYKIFTWFVCIKNLVNINKNFKLSRRSRYEIVVFFLFDFILFVMHLLWCKKLSNLKQCVYEMLSVIVYTTGYFFEVDLSRSSRLKWILCGWGVSCGPRFLDFTPRLWHTRLDRAAYQTQKIVCWLCVHSQN